MKKMFYSRLLSRNTEHESDRETGVLAADSSHFFPQIVHDVKSSEFICRLQCI